jgi:HNH endonuclease
MWSLLRKVRIAMTPPIPYNEKGHKRCGLCHEYKALTEFDKTKRTRDGLQSRCKVCRKAKVDPDTEKARARAWYQNNKERVADWGYGYRESHAEQKRQNDKKYRDEHKEQRKEYDSKREEENRKRARRYYRLYPDRVKVNINNRRIRLANAEGKFTHTEWQDLKTFYNNTCLKCGKQEPEILLTPDHIIPVSRRGSNDIGNIQPLCITCNKRKQAKTIDYRPLWQARKDDEPEVDEELDMLSVVPCGLFCGK